jgi:hypothetical protein
VVASGTEKFSGLSHGKTSLCAISSDTSPGMLTERSRGAQHDRLDIMLDVQFCLA